MPISNVCVFPSNSKNPLPSEYSINVAFSGFVTTAFALFTAIVPVFFTTTFILTICPSRIVSVVDLTSAVSSAPCPVVSVIIGDTFVSAIVPIDETLL